MIATFIEEQPEKNYEQTLARLLSDGNLAAIEIINADGQVVVLKKGQLAEEEQPELNQTLQLAYATNGADESLSNGRGFDAALVPLSGNRKLIVVPSHQSGSTLSETITDTQTRYSNLVTKQRKVRLLGLSTLGLLTLLLLFAATWIAIHLARGIAKPIQALAEASKEVARGNLKHRVETIADDELALLADSFNKMTAQLEENRRKIEAGAAELRDKNLALEERRNYIETVLESISTGVISLDENDCVTTIKS